MRRPTRTVWKNELGGLTFEIDAGDVRQFMKWTPTGSGIDLSAEVARLRWAAEFVAVPQVVDAGVDESGNWMLTTGLPGGMAVDECWKREPATAVSRRGGRRAAFRKMDRRAAR